MRDIKFRAWNKTYKSFVRGDILREYVLGDFMDDPDYIVTEFTGLKDKNGVEIYEGDILEYYDFRKGVFIFKEQPKRRAAIRWSQNDAQYRIPDMGFRIDTDKVEVVGNIYEDGHLVEGEENASGR